MSAPRSLGVARSACLLSLACLFIACQTVSATDLSGHWQGNWYSHSTGHKGPLRCTLTKVDESTYRASFAGRFFKIIPFRYAVLLTVASDDGQTVQLSGSQHLGRRLGTFTYSAEATCRDFVASYSSCKDCGEFVLSRCGR